MYKRQPTDGAFSSNILFISTASSLFFENEFFILSKNETFWYISASVVALHNAASDKFSLLFNSANKDVYKRQILYHYKQME